MAGKKNEKDRTDHDGLFKELLQGFFEEFMLLFFPEIYEEIDFAHLSFLDKELVNDINEREKRRVDLVVETRLREEDSLIIVHIEPQASFKKNFNERMFVYFSRLYEKYRKRIIPIAVFSYDDKREEPDQFQVAFPFLDVLRFQYLTIELKKLNWRDFIHQNNPVAAALLAKMGYNEKEKVQVKKDFLRMMVRMELDPSRNEMLTGFFETYLNLNESEERQLREEIQTLDPKEGKVMEIISSYRRQGRLEGKKDSICTLLKAKYGPSSSPLQERIREFSDSQLLDDILVKVSAAETLEDARMAVEKGSGQ